jgi:hypothetical protein
MARRVDSARVGMGVQGGRGQVRGGGLHEKHRSTELCQDTSFHPGPDHLHSGK